MTVTIEIMGGLGNQLFQIFTLISYSIKSQSPFYFENKYITCGVRKKYYCDTPLLNTLQGFIKPHLQEPLLIYQEPFFHYTLIPIVNDKHKNIKLNGYFQSYKYFEEHKEVILKMINLKETQQQIKEKITCYLPTTEFENVVSLHFRVGDYVNKQQYHPLMPLEYYENALKQMLIDSEKNDLYILFFCEENDIVYVNEKINYLKQNAKFKELTFIKVPSNLDDWEQMILMSLCRHHIIANSTFSWWGAYFGQGNGIVYYPSKWFGPALGEKNTDDLFLQKGWKKIHI